MQNLLIASGKPAFKTLRGFFATIKNLGVDISPTDTLLNRHIGPDAEETKQMLKVCGANSVQELIQQAIPDIIRDPNSLDWKTLGEPLAEYQYLEHLQQLMSQNKLFKNYIGYGYYPTITPSVIKRNILENPNWYFFTDFRYTPYTPYQAEISQGRLESLLNYQTIIEQLTALQISNASLLDEASSGAEALYMSYNLHEGERKKFFIDQNVFITTQAVVQTKARNLNIEIVKGNYEEFFQKHNPAEFFGFLVQTPDVNGKLHDFTSTFAKLSQSKVIKVVASDLLALTITKPPGEMGADICFGSAQRFGIPMGYGGPHAGFYATRAISIDKKENVRKMPGRIIGISSDRHDNFALRMALQTRQQHIRRDKATSNICTAQALLANMSAMYAIYHGPKGLRQISHRVHTLTQLSAKVWQSYGFQVLKDNGKLNFFDTFTVSNCDAEKLVKFFESHQINLRKNSPSSVSLSFSEVTLLEDVEQFNKLLAQFTGKSKVNLQSIDLSLHAFPQGLIRPENFMKQKIFNTMHSQNLMQRYIKSLETKDIALTRSMNTLGSCTMKLNAASEMIPMSWPELNVHPFVPKYQAKGYTLMIQQLRNWLREITGFDDVSFQSNSGATGEYTGLKAIKTYLDSIGQGHRNICLIPTTAHGTNPASAVLVGLKVIPVNVIDGEIDFNDFKAKVQTHSKNLACIMITFPSTSGIYDTKIKQMNSLVHQHGGQVYLDGANMNALVGYTSPGYLGADVCHLNLHKTFAIPHGGGGPGMGPIGVRKHLVPFLPSHPFSQNYNTKSLGTITSAEFSSASILAISYGYISMLGRRGVQKATAYAILNANYLMNKLSKHYPILNNKELKKCSHEFIIDCSQIKKDTKVTEEDIAKRMMDFGFHAPTMSFPTPGTLMIEPTESEDKGELDRFAETLIKIKEEAYSMPEIVKNAPYTAAEVTGSNWPHSFTREQAAYPLEWVKRRGKFWPSVARVNNAKGDKVLICSCPEVSSFVQ